MSEYIKAAQLLREMADIADKLAIVEEREKNGEDVGTEYHALIGQLVVKQAMMKNL